jgi:lysophospholipase L1-like esterase
MVREAGSGIRVDDVGLDELLRPLAGDGIFLVSMAEVFRPLDAAALFADGAHLRPTGHAILAQRILDRLLAQGIVRAATAAP